ncbi:MAG: nitrous oxide reductase accessory protein NosL [Sulfurovum sp.]|nr:nitrous oxide reductase accessory protein NosL [Sulfurovum sp.]MDD3498797.1 nitrous oxide reductase accessory protein NosL [Sulfurovum sp.]
MKVLAALFALAALLFSPGCTSKKEPIPKNEPAPLYLKTRFQTVATEQAILLQKGTHKNQCVICGRDLPTFYRTNHAAATKKNRIRQYCSLHCLVHDNEISKTDLYDVKVVDAATLKFIPVQSAFYVVGSNREATMSNFSKYTFAKRKDADAFAKAYGGYVMNFYDAYAIAMQDFTDEKR